MEKKKKFNYKEQKAILDARTKRSSMIMQKLKKERLEKEARKKAREKAKKAAEEADKKRSNYKIKKSVAVSTTRKASQRKLKIPKRK